MHSWQPYYRMAQGYDTMRAERYKTIGYGGYSMKGSTYTQHGTIDRLLHVILHSSFNLCRAVDLQHHRANREVLAKLADIRKRVITPTQVRLVRCDKGILIECTTAPTATSITALPQILAFW